METDLMQLFRRILLGLDLGDDCDDVWRQACKLARMFEAHIHIVHAIEELSARSPRRRELAHGVEGQLDELRNCAGADGARVSPYYFIRAGDPADAVLGCAADLAADLIVIGASRRSGLTRALSGDPTERIVRESDCPVWVVRSATGCEGRCVLASVDALAPEPQVVEVAAAVAAARGVRLDIVAFAGHPERDEGADRRIRGLLAATPAAAALDVSIDVRQATNRFVELRGAVERSSPDLLVLGDTAPRGVRRLLRRGSISGLVRAVPCSVLRIRTEHLAPVAAARAATEDVAGGA